MRFLMRRPAKGMSARCIGRRTRPQYQERIVKRRSDAPNAVG